MRILTIITGDYGRRHVDNLRAHAPSDRQIEVW
jgi:transcriptional regulator of met regulon